MKEVIDGQSFELKKVPRIEITPEHKFEFMLKDIVRHKFLNYHPYLMEDDDIIQDARERAREFTDHPTSIFQFISVH